MKKPSQLSTIILAAVLLLQLSTICFQARATPGDVDLSFDPGSGINNIVTGMALQSDGKLLVSGEFTTVKGLRRESIARLNADGSGDMSFDIGIASGYYAIQAITPLSDNNVLIGHYFGLARLNSNGSVDTNFVAYFDSIYDEYWAIANVHAMAVQPDGKIIVGGEFYVVNETNVNYGIARFNANGSLDTSFNAPLPYVGPTIYSLALQPDGKVLVGGAFSYGTNFNNIVRLNSNGSLDPSFDSGTGAGQTVRSVVMQPDGKVLIGGDFTSVNGTNRNGMARLNSNGSLDGSYISSIGGYVAVRSIALQANGKLLIGANFGTARLHVDGSVDNSFNPGPFNSGVNKVLLQPDNKVLVGGAFTIVNGTAKSRMARLNADGGLDGSFDSGRGLDYLVSSVVVAPDGKVLIGGIYTFISGTNQFASARLNTDGTPDMTFVSGSFNPDLSAIVTAIDCPPSYDCYRYFETYALAAQPDGKVLIGGGEVTISCDTFGGGCDYTFRSLLVRFNADGTRDTNFQAFIGGPSYNGVGVRAIALQPDGKIIFGASDVYRINANGSFDGSFNQGPVDAGAVVSALLFQPDGKILVGTTYGLARVNSDGIRDACFNPTFASHNVRSLALQPDGRVLVGGAFTGVNGISRNGIARLNENGSLDTSFDPGTGGNATIHAIALQSDGNILLGGDFLTINGILRPYVARLLGGSSAVLSPGPSLRLFATNNSVVAAWPSASTGFTLQQNTNFGISSWLNVTNTPATVGSENQITLSPTGQRFFRLFSTATNSPLPPAPPAVAPQLAATAGNGSVSLSWTAFAGATGHHLQRATGYYGPYTTIAYPSTTNYTDTTVVNGTTYYYIASVIYPCGESANSLPVGSTPYRTIHVQSITMSFVPQGPRYHTRAIVKVVDNSGTPFTRATVTGNFTGSINDTGRTGVTAANGEATITSSSTIKNGTVTFTVTGVVTGTFAYNPGANVVTSATISR